MESPEFGPHDEDMTLDEWFHITLARAADDDQERKQWEAMVREWRSRYKCRDVGGLMQLTAEQLAQSAMIGVGPDGAKGSVRQVLKYLGPKHLPHQPPCPLDSEGLSALVGEKRQVLFGRPGKSARDSSEHNFPEAMQPSAKSKSIIINAITLPPSLKFWIQERAATYSAQHMMPQHETSKIAKAVADWAVSMFGVSPVNIVSSYSSSFLGAAMASRRPSMCATHG